MGRGPVLLKMTVVTGRSFPVGFGWGNSRCGMSRPAGDGAAVAGPGCSNDWQATMLQAAVAWRCLVACAGCALLAAAGCTMCPDPYDYSGPVPNGSPPQNDFRVRSHGILPIGTAAKPFPPVVKSAPRPAPAAVQAAPVAPTAEQPEVAVEPDGDLLRLTAEEPVEDGSVADEAVDVPAVDGTAAGEVPAAVSDETPVGTPSADVEPALRESPGWRPRR